jgi:hypothetical protein
VDVEKRWQSMIRSLPPLLSLQLRNLYAETPCSFVSVMLTFALASEASQAQESLILQTRRLFFVFFFSSWPTVVLCWGIMC